MEGAWVTLGCACGGGSNATLEYEVTLPSGEKKIVSSKPEARILVASNKGGTYRAIPKRK